MSNPAEIFRSLDSNGDWQFGNGLGSYAKQERAVVLDVQTALQTFLGDAFWQATFGIDWFNLLGSRGTQAAIVAACRAMIATRWGVTGILTAAAALDRATRSLTLQFTISTVYSASASGTAQITV
jgi:hypothetical protein